MAKKAPRSSARLTWEEAIRLAEDEDGLKALLARRKGVATLASATLSRFRNDGVPIQELGPELLVAWRRVRSLPPEALSEGAHPMAEEQQVLWRQLMSILRDREHPQRLATIKTLLDEWAPVTGLTTRVSQRRAQ